METNLKPGDLVYLEGYSIEYYGYVAVIAPLYMTIRGKERNPRYGNHENRFVVIELLISTAHSSLSWRRTDLLGRIDEDFSDILQWKSLSSDQYMTVPSKHIKKFNTCIKDIEDDFKKLQASSNSIL